MIGNVDGKNKLFIINKSPAIGSEIVCVNGSQQIVDADYSILDKDITFTIPPLVNAIVSVTYTKRYCDEKPLWEFESSLLTVTPDFEPVEI